MGGLCRRAGPTRDVLKNSHILGVSLLIPAFVLDVPLLWLLLSVAATAPTFALLDLSHGHHAAAASSSAAVIQRSGAADITGKILDTTGQQQHQSNRDTTNIHHCATKASLLQGSSSSSTPQQLVCCSHLDLEDPKHEVEDY